MRAHWVDDESGRITVSQPYSLVIGCIPAKWSYPDPELAVLAPVGTDNPTLRMYLADPGHPMWKDSLPFELPRASVKLVDVETVQFRLTVHPGEPISAPPGDWEEIEQGGADFGATPRYVGTPSDRRSPSDPPTAPLPVAPDLLASIADGWNMVRVYSRNRYPFSTETEIAIDIWPTRPPIRERVTS